MPEIERDRTGEKVDFAQEVGRCAATGLIDVAAPNLARCGVAKAVDKGADIL